MHWRQVFLVKRLGPAHLIDDTQRGTARLPNRCFTSRQPERAKMRHALERFLLGEQKFSAPDGAIGSVAGAIPRHTESWILHFVLRHAGKDMRPMVLDRMQGGIGLRRQFRRELGRKIIGVHVARDDFGLHVVKAGQVRGHRTECGVGLARFEIADMLLMKASWPTLRATVFFKCAPTARTLGSGVLI